MGLQEKERKVKLKKRQLTKECSAKESGIVIFRTAEKLGSAVKENFHGHNSKIYYKDLNIKGNIWNNRENKFSSYLAIFLLPV